MIALLLALAAQDSATWVARPRAVTVGDTVWIERVVSAPRGWAVRAGRLAPGGPVEPLAEPVVERDGDAWRVTYTLVAWHTGRLTVPIPAVWRLAPNGAADSVAGGTALIFVASVLPDSGAAIAPAVAPLRPPVHRAGFVLAGIALAAATIAGAVAWRRRAPRRAERAVALHVESAVADDRWIATGEPRAVAARAAATLRAAIARAAPAAHPGLSTDECLEVFASVRPEVRIAGVTDVLHQLDRTAFASVHGDDVAVLASRARALAADVSR